MSAHSRQGPIVSCRVGLVTTEVMLCQIGPPFFERRVVDVQGAFGKSVERCLCQAGLTVSHGFGKDAALANRLGTNQV